MKLIGNLQGTRCERTGGAVGEEGVGGHARRERAGNLVKLQRLQEEESARGPCDDAH